MSLLGGPASGAGQFMSGGGGIMGGMGGGNLPMDHLAGNKRGRGMMGADPSAQFHPSNYAAMAAQLAAAGIHGIDAETLAAAGRMQQQQQFQGSIFLLFIVSWLLAFLFSLLCLSSYCR
jgi:hypothetical protein